MTTKSTIGKTVNARAQRGYSKTKNLAGLMITTSAKLAWAILGHAGAIWSLGFALLTLVLISVRSSYSFSEKTHAKLP